MTIQKLKKSNEFRHVFSTGNRKIGKYVVLYMLHLKQDNNRVGFVTKKNIGNAVQRNKVKRILREIWRTSCSHIISGYDIIILARKKIVQAKYNDIEAELVKLIQS